MLPPSKTPPKGEPIFNLPITIGALVAIITAIHIGRIWLLTNEANFQLILNFAFIPARYLAFTMQDNPISPGYMAAALWTFISYTFLHADWLHLSINIAWMMAFGSALERRFGAIRFLIFSGLTTIAGATIHLIIHWGDITPMIGASAMISGQMAAASRFIFGMGGPLRHLGEKDSAYYHSPAQPLSAIIKNQQFIIFVGFWFAINIIFGIGSTAILGEKQAIAWEAHIGGFLAGLALFSFFDPVPPYQRNISPSPKDKI